MAQIALPRHQVTQSQSAGIGAPLYQRRPAPSADMVEMVPNPDFSFPMRAPDATSEPHTSKARPMSLQAYPTARRGSMPHARRQKSVNALPEFSFNPAGSTQPATENSPPVSPGLSPNTPARPIHGHRRGGSELIGGNARTGAMSLLSTSPTKDGSLSPPTATMLTGPPAGRRGHAHRRSGAVSSHDLSSIMSPPPAKTGSAPSTPSNANDFKFGHSVNKSISQPCLRNSSSDDETTPRPPSRARVGFSDKVEYIRPLSTISSETETSLSTFRGHSATNSLSSIIGGSGPSSQFGRSVQPSLSTIEDEGRRPSTAGAVLDKIMSNSRDEVASDPHRLSAIPRSIPSAGSSPTSPNMTKRRHFFRLESRRNETFAHKLPASASDPALSRFIETSQTSPVADENESVEEEDKAKSSSRKSGLKPRKVKSWANSIIPRKGKQSKKSKRRASTPPPESAPDAEDTDTSEDIDFSPNFDDDNSVTIVSPLADVTPRPKVNTDYASWQPRQLQRVDSDVMSPIIDMDAALGPFNTPTGNAPRNQQRGFGAHRRAMHSANGPAPSHRRTESAPELVPFEFRPSAVASTSPMADVFEEEEPEDDPSALKETPKAVEPEPIEEPKVQAVETDIVQDGPAINWNFKNGLGLKRIEIPSGVESDEPVSPRATTQPSENEARDSSTVEVVEDYEEPRTSSLTHSSDSTVTPQATVDEMKEHQPSMAVPLPLSQQSLMTPDTVTSSFSSPDYRSSQASFDTPRVGTAASSINDYPNMPSPRFGEPGPELRISTDDVPSLTSSRSTMTSAMQNAFALATPRRPGDRSASLCSAPSEIESRRRKRSSIASLSRLINSSYGEKSKLSIEQRPQSEYLEPAKEQNKNNKRLSKLKFWKSTKDSSSRV
jgi:hypothetical protein